MQNKILELIKEEISRIDNVITGDSTNEAKIRLNTVKNLLETLPITKTVEDRLTILENQLKKDGNDVLLTGKDIGRIAKPLEPYIPSSNIDDTINTLSNLRPEFSVGSDESNPINNAMNNIVGK